MKPVLYRQGDVLITRIDKTPKDVQPVAPVQGRFVLAEGEATGHAHAVLAGPGRKMTKDSTYLYLDVEEETEVVHEEHDTIPLPPGSYRISQQREYSPAAIRTVAD